MVARRWDEDAIQFRPMELNDLSEVMRIETLAHLFPWSERVMQDCLHAGYTCSVIELRQLVVGFSLLSFAADEAHLLNICIDPMFQRQGLGRQLMENVMRQSRERKVKRIFLEVRISNQSALQLYQSMGFRQIGVRRDYYPAEKGKEDALVLSKTWAKPLFRRWR